MNRDKIPMQIILVIIMRDRMVLQRATIDLTTLDMIYFSMLLIGLGFKLLILKILTMLTILKIFAEMFGYNQLSIEI